jgi:predicted small secreted protein
MQHRVVRRRPGNARTVPLALLLLATVVAACQGSIPSTGADIDTRQAVLDLNQNIVDVREENAMLQAQVDSIRGVVAYQDSVLRQLAVMAGLPMRPQSAPMQ